MALNSFGDRVRQHRACLLAGAALAPLGLSIVFVPLRIWFSNVGAALSMVAVIEAAAILDNRLTGILATLSVALWFDFFLISTNGRLMISRRPEFGVMVTDLIARSRRHLRAIDEEPRLFLMLRGGAELSAGVNLCSDVTEFVTRSLVDVLELTAGRFNLGVAEPPLVRIYSGGDVVCVGLHWPVGEIGSTGPEIGILCRHRCEMVGQSILTPTRGPAISSERRNVAVAQASPVAPLLREVRSPRELV